MGKNIQHKEVLITYKKKQISGMIKCQCMGWLNANNFKNFFFFTVRGILLLMHRI